MAQSESADELGELETKFFGHSFRFDTDSIRLGRIEKQIFGKATTGDTNERLVKIKETVSSAGLEAQWKDLNFVDAADSDYSDNTQAYPRICALEKFTLGRTFNADPVQLRLRRLEQKAFTSVQGKAPMLDRIEKLEIAAHIQHVYLIMENPEFMSVDSMRYFLKNPAAFAAKYKNLSSDHVSLNDWIDTMEIQVIGRSNPTAPLLDRIANLEAKKIPNANKNALMMHRIHALMSLMPPAADEKAPVPEHFAAGIAPIVNPAKNDGDKLTQFKMPINPAVQMTDTKLSLNGFQMPVNPAVSMDSKRNIDSLKSLPKDVLHKLSRPMQLADQPGENKHAQTYPAQSAY